MRIAVVTCCSTSWLPYALATHYSVSRNVGLAVDHFAITDDAGMAKATALTEKFNAHYGLSIRHECIKHEALAGYHVGASNTSTLYRLKLPQILPTDYDRVLHLDSDLLILRPLDDLLTSGMGGMPMAAVDDVWISLSDHTVAVNIRKAIGFTADDTYFNSGVMLFDWKKIVSAQIMEKALAILRHDNLLFPDQCSLNKVMRKSWKSLPIEYNWLNLFDDILDADPVIRHFTDNRKPWSDKCRSRDSAHRKFYSGVLENLGLEPLPATSLPILANRVQAMRQRLKTRWKVWFRNKPDEMRQLREYVHHKVPRLSARR